MIGVSALHREGANIKGGDKITVNIELDTEERIAEVPADLEKRLKKDPVAKKNFDALSYSKKRAFIIPINDAKTEETRQRRIEKTLELLKENKK